MRRSLLWMAVLAGCSLTHSLDDLKGGSPGAGGSGGSTTGGDAGDGGAGAVGGEPGAAGEAGSGVAGAAGQAGGGAVSPWEVRIENLRSGSPAPKLVFTDALELEFSAAMNADSLEPAGHAFCTGSVLLSSDDFESCVEIAVTPTAGGTTAQSFTISPAEPLEVGATYTLRITADVESETGDTLADGADLPFQAIYRHTIAIDGTNDFLPGETFDTTSGANHTAYVAWDDDTLYLGMKGTTIDDADVSKWLVAYFGPIPLGSQQASSVGDQYQTQTPTLTFQATHYVRWKGDNGFTWLKHFDGDAWTDDYELAAGTDYQQNGDFVELRLPLENIGEPADWLKFAMGMLDEEVGSETTYAGVPDNTFPTGDGPDRDFEKRFEFDFAGDKFPNEFSSL